MAQSETKRPQTRISGQTIINELIRNMELGRLEMEYSILLPCIFSIYLHPDDYERLAGVESLIREDAGRALTARMAEWNGKNSLFRRGTPRRVYRIAQSDWWIELFADMENSVPPGDVEIHSELNEAPQPGYRGVKTTLIEREPSVTSARVARDRESTRRQPDKVFAEIRYQDDSGPQTYFVKQNEVSVGRGGEDLWVDLPLYTNDEVSREHLKLRRDPASGAFTIVDNSRNGTWLNGRKLSRGVEESLPGSAEIKVAEVLKLSFEARKMKELYGLHTPFVIGFLAFVVVFMLAHWGEPRMKAWSAGAATDTGLVRGRNEDRYWMDDERGVFLVVDGVGGHAAGELAAETAVEEIRESLFAVDCGTEERVRRAIARANNRIFELGQEAGERKGMACVLTLALVEDGTITIGHVGDSRLYLIWKGAIRKLTPDHSPVGEDEDAGELTEEEAMLHPRRNEVFRDVGSHPHTPDDDGFVEIRTCRFRPDAAILLCSDGLTDRLTSARVRDITERYDGDPEQVAASLVEAANQAGGQDNVTALFVAGAEFRGRSGATRPRLAGAMDIADVPELPGRATRPARRQRLLTGRVAFLTYGIFIGMLLWVVVRMMTRG